MRHPRIVTRLLVGTVMLLLATSAMAADPVSPAATQSSSAKLDLSTPPITDTLTQAQIDAVLARTVDPRNIEEVEVDRSRLNDPHFGEYIPNGIAALIWGVANPTGIWKLFVPMRALRARAESIDPTNPGRPAPGIPAAAGELRPYED